MLRYVIAGVLGCLYVAGSIWLVRNEGLSFRRSLSKAKPVAADFDKSSRSSPATTENSAQADSADSAATPSGAEPTAAAPASISVARSTPKPKIENPPPGRSAIELKPPPASPPAAVRPPGQPPLALGLADNPLAHNPFWNRPELMQDRDLTNLKLRDERQLGADFYSLIAQLGLIDEESPFLSRVEEAAEPFRNTLRRKDVKYKYFILKSDAVNAFSTPGGYIYVSRGLFELIGEEEDYALQFAIGHEMAHVDLEHAIKCLQDPDVKKMPMGTLQKLFWLIIPFGYLVSDKVDQEFDADQWVLDRMQRSRSRREILIFLTKLYGYAEKNDFRNGRAKPKPGRGISLLENHYRSQTAVRKRLKNLQELMAKTSGSQK